MRAEVRLAASAVGDVGVALGRSEIGVAEHLLDAAQVGAAFEQVCRERVAEEVRVDAPRFEPRLLGEPPQDQKRAGARQRATAGVEEQVGPVAPVEVRPTECEIAAHGLDGGSPERDDPLLVALADHAHGAPSRSTALFAAPTASETRRPRRREARRARGRALRAASPRWQRRSDAPSRPAKRARQRPRAGVGRTSSAAGLSARAPSSTSWRKNERSAARAAGDRRRGEPVGAHLGDPALELLGRCLREQAAAEGAEGGEVATVRVHRPRRTLCGEEEQEALGVGV